MYLTESTLVATSKNFRDALKARGLILAFSTANNVWAQIVLGKNYSSAMSQLRHQGHALMQPCSTERIITILAKRSRFLEPADAAGLFADALGRSLATISPFVDQLSRILKKFQHIYLTGFASASPTGIGFIEHDKHGYVPLPADNPSFGILSSDAQAWLKSSSSLMADVIQLTAGRTKEQITEANFSMIRADVARDEREFLAFCYQNASNLSQKVKDEFLKLVSGQSVQDWNHVIDFEITRQLVSDVLEDVFTEIHRRAGRSLLHGDNSRIDLLYNHLASEIKRVLKIAEDSELMGYEQPFDVHEELSIRIQNAMQLALA